MSCKIEVKHLPQNIVENALYVIQQSNPNDYTHNYFKYPCKFIPEIPRWAIKYYMPCDDDRKLILDPFSGSGTTLLEASICGIESIGCEIDNLAKLVTKVKTTKLTEADKVEVLTFLEGIDADLDLSKEDYDKPLINNLDHWYKKEVSDVLAGILHRINLIENVNVKDFLLVCFASILKKVSNADDVSPKPYISSKIQKKIPDVIVTFKTITVKFLKEMDELRNCNLAHVSISGDALNVNTDDNTVSLAVTSPPYINAFDYVRTLRLENLWLGLSTEDLLLKKKRTYVGTENIVQKVEEQDLSILNESNLLAKYYLDISLVDKKRALVVKKFFEDMKANLQEVYRTLKPNCYYIIVIGNSNIRKIEVESWKVLKQIAANIGYSSSNHISYEIQNPYIRIPRSGNGGKISVDHILLLRK